MIGNFKPKTAPGEKAAKITKIKAGKGARVKTPIPNAFSPARAVGAFKGGAAPMPAAPVRGGMSGGMKGGFR